MKFFFDNCTSPRLAAAIGAISEYEVKHLRDLFSADTPDIDWLRQLAEEGDWIIISGDTRIFKTPHEREAWHSTRLTGFFWSPQWLKKKLWEQAWRLVRWWPKIEDQAKLIEAGAAFEIPLKHTSKFRQITNRNI
jgi:PIN like domain